jgi:hypothetical protein
VSVNPVGRLGAPETEPGPSGAGRPVDDELMRIPFHKRYCLTIFPRASASRQWTSLAITLAWDTAQKERPRQARRFTDAGR